MSGAADINRSVDAFAENASTEAHHRIANSLAILASLIYCQVKELPSAGVLAVGDVRDMLKDLGAKLSAVGDLHRFLISSWHSGAIDLAGYLRRIVTSVSHSLTEEKQTIISCEFPPDCTVSASLAVAIGLFTIEAITNAVKYAHPQGETGAIRVFIQNRPGLTIEVEDDGVGFPKGFDPFTNRTVGLRIMRRIADQHGGHLTFATQPRGLSVRLELPFQVG